MSRLAVWFHQKDFALFNFINHSCHHKYLDPFFRSFTHLGGATCTISIALLFTMSAPAPYSFWAIDSLIALTVSHIIVSIIKKMYQRNRPYLTYPETKTISKRLTDYSFPSGHTTAIFSIVTPFMLYMPSMAIYLFCLAGIVGLSRIYIGLHYPSDVLAGAFIGVGVGVITVYLHFIVMVI